MVIQLISLYFFILFAQIRSEISRDIGMQLHSWDDLDSWESGLKKGIHTNEHLRPRFISFPSSYFIPNYDLLSFLFFIILINHLGMI